MINLKYLVTGTGRCGTVYTARVLTSVGIPCGHEVIFDHLGIEAAEERLKGSKELELSLTSRLLHKGDHCELVPPYLDNLNDLMGDSSYMAAPYITHSCLESASIIHVVRNPILVVNSFVNYLNYFKSVTTLEERSKFYQLFIVKNIPELKEDMATYDRAALYWVRWNELIEHNSQGKNYARFMVEEGPLPILNWLGCPPKDFFDDRSINTYKDKSSEIFTLDKLKNNNIKEQFVNLGRKYGYSMDSKKILL